MASLIIYITPKSQGIWVSGKICMYTKIVQNSILTFCKGYHHMRWKRNLHPTFLLLQFDHHMLHPLRVFWQQKNKTVFGRDHILAWNFWGIENLTIGPHFGFWSGRRWKPFCPLPCCRLRKAAPPLGPCKQGRLGRGYAPTHDNCCYTCSRTVAMFIFVVKGH